MSRRKAPVRLTGGQVLFQFAVLVAVLALFILAGVILKAGLT